MRSPPAARGLHRGLRLDLRATAERIGELEQALAERPERREAQRALAAEMTAYDPTSGELRTHYAGFFDPGFGFDAAGQFHGSRAALEVRAHDVPFMIEHGQAVCKLTFERMLEPPEILYGPSIGSSYQRQDETLSRYFRRPGG